MAGDRRQRPLVADRSRSLIRFRDSEPSDAANFGFRQSTLVIIHATTLRQISAWCLHFNVVRRFKPTRSCGVHVSVAKEAKRCAGSAKVTVSWITDATRIRTAESNMNKRAIINPNSLSTASEVLVNVFKSSGAKMTPIRKLLLGLSVAFAIGCGVSGPKPENLVPVSGTVKFNGRPAERIRLTFHPTGENKALGGCWGITDSQGKYTVKCMTNKEGIPAGTYHVTFSRFVKPDGSPLGANESPTMTTSSESVAPLWSDVSRAKLHNKVDVPEKGSTSLDFSISGIQKK